MTSSNRILLNILGRTDSVGWKTWRHHWGFHKNKELMFVHRCFSLYLTVSACLSDEVFAGFQTWFASLHNSISQYLAIHLWIFILLVLFFWLNPYWYTITNWLAILLDCEQFNSRFPKAPCNTFMELQLHLNYSF